MNPTEKLNHKHSSLEKWKNIVELFEELQVEERENCGYCDVYINEEGHCNDCPLYQENACTNHRTDASYWKVVTSIDDGLENARHILRVVEKDLGEWMD